MQLKQYLEKDINEALYFNKKDLLKDTPLNNAIRKYIDKNLILQLMKNLFKFIENSRI